MKRVVAILLSLAMLLSATACSSNSENSESSPSSEQVQTDDPIHLTNKMTEAELARVDKHGLTLLDEPEEPTTAAEPEQTEHKVSVELLTISIDEMRENIEEMRDNVSDEEYEKALERLQSAIDSGEHSLTNPRYILVDGYLMPYLSRTATPIMTAASLSLQ